MLKFFLHLSYSGTAYRGWQRQHSVPSVQETIESALEQMFNFHIPVVGCGRTDAEVHASQFVAHISLPARPDFDIVTRLNYLLPTDISIHGIKEVDNKAHAQFDAIQRTYTYFIHFNKSPFLGLTSSYYPGEGLEIEKISSALSDIPEIVDFRSLCIKPDAYKHTQCRMESAHLFYQKEEERLVFQFTSNRFLRGMVRLLIGNLLEVGYGKKEGPEFLNLIHTKDPVLPAKYAYPQGLFLSSVRYRNTNFDPLPSHNFEKLLRSTGWNQIN